ncbi:MAG: nucleotidyltransferase domain-containing protein [Chloroflexi bacterium]|nr:nucleotidyltransferase domain-containing protein [Chloroflexota bacterium]MBP8058625.1 nucleotidyltransferase domain-containing protein [Chloroflexota bacterium]
MIRQTLSPEVVLEPVLKVLGPQAQSAYLYGSYAQGFYQPGESDINLLVIMTDEGDIHAVREALLPVWTANVAAAFQHPPALVRRTHLARHFRLNPAFAYHLTHEGQHLAGRSLGKAPDSFDRADLLAQDINQSMIASAAIAEHLLEPEIAQERRLKLRHLARRLSRQPQAVTKNAVQLLSCVQEHLQKRFEALPAPPTVNGSPDEEAPPLLPDLQAIYEVTEEVLLVLPDLSGTRLTQTDWRKVGDLLAGDYNGLRLVTPAQLHLALRYANPLGIRLLRYNHAWGRNSLDSIPVNTAAICREASRYCSHLLTITLPQLYLAADEEEVSKVIHDLQNKLLNVQLQHELLHRLLGWERLLPPTPLPDRHTPFPQRIEAIATHLDWWSQYYLNLGQTG